jgi:uncharacterized damage-inducible protein DinB
MFLTVDQFTRVWKGETAATVRLLDKLTDASLDKPSHEIIRSVGRAAWHIVATYPEMCRHFGITIDTPTENDPIPATAAAIKAAYQQVSEVVLNHVSRWTDADLKKEIDMYGETWTYGKALWALMMHEVHHRGQLSVIMRLADLPVTGIYGPAREEWTKYGMTAPEL